MTGQSKLTREGWTLKTDHESVQIDGKQYRNMREWLKPCAVCGSPITMFDKQGATTLNSGFGMKTCKDHRGLLPAFEKQLLAWDAKFSRLIAGPAVSGAAAALPPAELAELESLRIYKATVDEELKELDSLRRENHSLKTAAGKVWSPQDTTTDMLRRQFMEKLEAQKLNAAGKLPWTP